jgi:hypothetical protein
MLTHCGGKAGEAATPCAFKYGKRGIQCTCDVMEALDLTSNVDVIPCE